MNKISAAKWIGCNIMAGLALACSGESDIDSPELTAPTELSSDSAGGDGQLEGEALLNAGVTSEEMLVLEEYFARSSSGAPTSMEGRLLRWDDALMTVDDVLARVARMDRPDLIQKAYVETTAANPTGGNSIEFWRPDIGGLYYIIIENDVPNYVFTAVSQVIPEWTGLAVDCLGTPLFQVIRRSAYNALTQTQKDVAYEVVFKFIAPTSSAWTCGRSAIACADFPNFQTIRLSGSNVSRMAVGDNVLVDSTVHPSNDVDKLKRTLRHEFGHTFGFDHQSLLAGTHQLPGTQSCGQICSVGQQYASVMRTAGAGGVFSDDDRKALRTLYANEPNRNNDDCQYVDGFRVLNALP